jgi:hypothetical protein
MGMGRREFLRLGAVAATAAGLGSYAGRKVLGGRYVQIALVNEIIEAFGQ